MLLAGMGLACLIAVFEFIWKSRKTAVASAGDDTRTNFWSEMAQEVKSNFGSNGIKPNRKYSQAKNDNSSTTSDDQPRHNLSDDDDWGVGKKAKPLRVTLPRTGRLSPSVPPPPPPPLSSSTTVIPPPPSSSEGLLLIRRGVANGHHGHPRQLGVTRSGSMAGLSQPCAYHGPGPDSEHV